MLEVFAVKVRSPPGRVIEKAPGTLAAVRKASVTLGGACRLTYLI